MMNAHKRIALCLVFMMVVTACANVATPISFASPTSTSISTPTLIPITPTVAAPTVEPSPTVDPRFGIAPTVDAGFTLGTDMTLLRYTETDASGDIRYWSPEINGWMESRMKNGPIDLTGYGDGIRGDIPLNFSVYFADNFEFAKDGKYLIHPPGTSDFVTKNVAPASLASKITLDLWY